MDKNFVHKRMAATMGTFHVKDFFRSPIALPTMNASHMKKTLLFLFALPFITACASGPSKEQLNAEVNRLCAIDGGVKIYETVTLPPDKFDKWGQINFYRPTQGKDTLGADYIYQGDIHYYKKGESAKQGAQEIALKRNHIQVIRKSDMKLLGEVVMYNRVGNDLPGPLHHSSYQCPDRLIATEGILLNEVFTQSIEKNKK